MMENNDIVNLRIMQKVGELTYKLNQKHPKLNKYGSKIIAFNCEYSGYCDQIRLYKFVYTEEGDTLSWMARFDEPDEVTKFLEDMHKLADEEGVTFDA